jgi:glycolate oxidase FAD binding subunit
MADLNKMLNGLVQIVGRDYVKTDPKELGALMVDGVAPQAAVLPKDARQVSEIVKFANAEKLALLPRGSGTKIGAGNPPRRLDLLVATSRLNHIPDVDSDNLTITVESGVKLKEIQARLANEEDRCYLPIENVTRTGEMICSDREKKGLFLPIDAPFIDEATIGGVIAANSSGPRRLLYGLPRDLVLGVRFVAPNGEIIGAGGKTVKNVSGYDMSKLMIGSAGTLGIIIDMTMRLLPMPEKMETLLFGFDSLEKVSTFTDDLFATRLLPAAVEVMNGAAFDITGLRDLGPAAYVAAIAMEGFDEPVARMRRDIAEIAAKSGMKKDILLAEEAHLAFWRAVSNLAAHAGKRFPGFIAVQLNYPSSEWKRIQEFSENALSARRIPYTSLIHSGSGVAHLGLLLEAAPAGEGPLEAIREILGRCEEAGGNLVIQQAPSGMKKGLPVWGSERSDLPIMKRIKGQVDPSGIMSPGRFVGGL